MVRTLEEFQKVKHMIRGLSGNHDLQKSSGNIVRGITDNHDNQ